MATEYAVKQQENASGNARMVAEEGKNLTGTSTRANPRPRDGKKLTDKL
jgi:hypothetical protein